MFTFDNEKSLKNVKCQFCYSAAMEEIMSLHVMSEPEAHPICGEFVMHIYEGLPKDMQEEIDFFGEKLGNWRYVLDLVGLRASEYVDAACDLPIVLERIRTMTQDEFSYYMTGLSVPEFRISLNEFSDWYPDADRCRTELEKRQYDLLEMETVVYVLTHTEEVRERLLRILQEYWDEAFSQEWEIIHEYVREVVSYEEIALSHTTLLQYLSSFHPQLKMEGGFFIFDKKPKLVAEIAGIKTLVITPSVFGDNHLHGHIYGSQMNMLLNLNYRALQISRPIPADFFQLLHVLGDESRFRILKVLWTGDATTKEISEILRLAPSTISLHLKLLKEADLVTSSKVKKYVYYRLKKDRLLTFQEQLLNHLKY